MENWLKRNWRTVFIATLVSTVPIHFGIKYYFWDLSAEAFDHIFSPIAGLISAIGVVATLVFVSRQNKIILSQTLKPSFDERFNRLLENFEKTNRFPTHPTINNVKGSDIINLIHKTYTKLVFENQHFKDDLQYRYSHEKFKYGYYQDRSYWHELEFLASFTVRRCVDYDAVVAFLLDVNNSKLIKEEKNELKRKVEDILVKDYIAFVEGNDFDQTIYLIPNIHFPDKRNGEISYVQLHKSPFRDYYDALQAALR